MSFCIQRVTHERLVYTAESEGHNLPLTTFVLTDLDSTAGAELAKEVLAALVRSTLSRSKYAHLTSRITKGRQHDLCCIHTHSLHGGANSKPSPGLSGLVRNLGAKLHEITPSACSTFCALAPWFYWRRLTRLFCQQKGCRTYYERFYYLT